LDTTVPRTATFCAPATSCGVKNEPYLHGQLRISGKSVSVPVICVDQFWLPAMTWALAHAHAALREVAGVDVDHVGAGGLDAFLDRRARAGAERHHGDDGADADDHAKHGQDGAHLVAVERLQRDPQGHED
jgi:hypothetical protein